jgi:hypothetical protein
MDSRIRGNDVRIWCVFMYGVSLESTKQSTGLFWGMRLLFGGF